MELFRMKKLLLISILGIGAVLGGCSTIPVTADVAEPVPNNRIYVQSYFSKQSLDQARVIFLRDKGSTGSGCTHDIYANNEKIFSIRSNEKAVIFLKPDYYIFRLETGGGMCPNIATSQETELKPNTEAEYRILLPSDMNLRLTRIK